MNIGRSGTQTARLWLAWPARREGDRVGCEMITPQTQSDFTPPLAMWQPTLPESLSLGFSTHVNLFARTWQQQHLLVTGPKGLGIAASRSTRPKADTTASPAQQLLPHQWPHAGEPKGPLSARGRLEGLVQCWIKLNVHLLLKLLVFLPSGVLGSLWMWWKCGHVAKTAVWSLWSAGYIFRVKGDLHRASFFYSEPRLPNMGRKIHSSLKERENLAFSSEEPRFESKLQQLLVIWPSYDLWVLVLYL